MVRKGEQLDIYSREQRFGNLKESLFPLSWENIFHPHSTWAIGFPETRLCYLHVVRMQTCCLLRVQKMGSKESRVRGDTEKQQAVLPPHARSNWKVISYSVSGQM